MEDNHIGAIRKYYYEKYESFQYQLMIIAGGTLTVFVSFNDNDSLLNYYKYGFSLLGCSLIAGALSIVVFQVHFILINEYTILKKELENDKSGNNETALNIYQSYFKKGYLGDLNIFFGLAQLVLFLIGLTLIIIGLMKSPT